MSIAPQLGAGIRTTSSRMLIALIFYKSYTVNTVLYVHESNHHAISGGSISEHSPEALTYILGFSLPAYLHSWASFSRSISLLKSLLMPLDFFQQLWASKFRFSCLHKLVPYWLSHLPSSHLSNAADSQISCKMCPVDHVNALLWEKGIPRSTGQSWLNWQITMKELSRRKCPIVCHHISPLSRNGKLH